MIDLFAEPPSSNLAWAWVSAVLPGDATGPWGQTLSVFTTVLFFAGTVGLAYGVISGIVASAYTGKVLGTRWHQIWTPLRIVVGLGLLCPIPSSGFSPSHYILRDVVARGGINLADAAWHVFVSEVAKDGVPLSAASENGSMLAMTVLRHETCAAVYNHAGGKWGWSINLPPVRGEQTTSATDHVVAWSYGGTCGRFLFSIPERRQGFSDSRRSAVAELVSSLRAEAQKYAQIAAETQGISSADGITNAVSSRILSPDLAGRIRSMGQAYDKKIAAAAQSEAANLSAESRGRLVEAARQQGFLTAGVYWRALSEISALTTSLSNEQADILIPRTDSDFGEAIERAFKILALQMTGESERVSLSANDFAAAGDESGDFLTRLLAPIARSMSEWAATAEKGNDQDAMGALISSGHSMIAAGWAAIAAGGVAMVASSNWFSEAVGAGGAATWFLDWTKWVVGGLMILGAIRAYVIPMMPFLFVTMAGIATLAALVEAMIALPLWALKWLRMDNGGDFAGESVRMGMLLIINLALRPVLAVLALCAAYPVFEMTLGTLDKLWPTAFLSQTGGHVVGLVGFIVLVGMQAYLVWHVGVKAFGQIWRLPDRVLAWVGQTGTGGEAQMTSGAVGGMLALAGRGSLPNMTGSLMRGEKTK